jgi:hypothetical protein
MVGARLAFLAAIVGIPALAMIGGADLVASKTQSADQDEVAAAPAPPLPAQTAEADEAMRFLFGVRVVYHDAVERCRAAAGCATVDRSASSAPRAVRNVREVPACIRQLLPPCEAAALHFAAQKPPDAIAEMWVGIANHLGEALGRARALAGMVDSGRQLRVPLKHDRESVFDSLPYSDPDARRAREGGSSPVAAVQWRALDEWLQERGACEGAAWPSTCGLDSALGDEPHQVGARYAAWYRGSRQE